MGKVCPGSTPCGRTPPSEVLRHWNLSTCLTGSLLSWRCTVICIWCLIIFVIVVMWWLRKIENGGLWLLGLSWADVEVALWVWGCFLRSEMEDCSWARMCVIPRSWVRRNKSGPPTGFCIPVDFDSYVSNDISELCAYMWVGLCWGDVVQDSSLNYLYSVEAFIDLSPWLSLMSAHSRLELRSVLLHSRKSAVSNEEGLRML